MNTKPPASEDKTAKVVSITSALKKKKDRWPEAVMARGYTQVPSILLWGQARLGLEPDELNVLLQIISHRWTVENDPFLSKSAIARRIGKSERMVQRHLTSLEVKGFSDQNKRRRAKTEAKPA